MMIDARFYNPIACIVIYELHICTVETLMCTFLFSKCGALSMKNSIRHVFVLSRLISLVHIVRFIIRNCCFDFILARNLFFEGQLSSSYPWTIEILLNGADRRDFKVYAKFNYR